MRKIKRRVSVRPGINKKNKLTTAGKDIRNLIDSARENLSAAHSLFKEDEIGWNFIHNTGGMVHGLGNAGIETFKGAPIESLAREICQNSLDACKDLNQPVRVEFSLGTLPEKTYEELNLSDVRNYIKMCAEFWEGQEKKTEEFLKKALKEMKSKGMSFLRISDFNTRGLEGSGEKFNTPWSNLVSSTGISSKADDAGGSFGIGKSAAFNNSRVRTIFYTTKDIEGVEATQGVSQLLSYQNINEDATIECYSGEGFFGQITNNDPIQKWQSLDLDFNRDETGTDLYILGPDLSKNWADQIRIAVIQEFLLSIYFGRLSVSVDGEEISQETLKDYVNRYQSKLKGTYDYYKTLTSEDTKTFELEFNDLGKFTLKALYEPDLNRKVLMSRKNGMKIFELKRFPKLTLFSGICYLEDSRLNKFFKEMENPQHNAWEPERAPDPKKAKQYMTEFQRLVRRKIVEENKTIVNETVDAKGVGEFLPDTETANKPGSVPKSEATQEKKENSDKSRTSDQEEKKPDFEGIYQVKEIKYNPGNISLIDQLDDEQLRKVRKHGNKKTKRKGKSGNPADLPVEYIRDYKQIEVRTLRLIELQENKYRLIFQTHEEFETIYIELLYSGEQNTFKTDIKEARVTGLDKDLLIRGNRIYLGQTTNEKTILEFEPSDNFDCPMEIQLYGFKQ